MANSKNEIRLEKSMKVLNKMKREQARTIKKMYEDVLEDVKSYNFSNSELENIHLNDLKESILRNLKNINGKLEVSLKNKMKYVSASVIDDVNSVFYVNKDVKAQLKAGFADVPFDVVNNVCNGKVYADNWQLSSAIWGDYEKKKDDINYILAQGRAKNKTAYEIAKDLEKYVDPSARKDWSWSKVYPNSNKVVDYNAQRLVRTLLHHAYQQSLEVAISDNPYIEYVKWHSALDEKRTCKLCKERHGKLYPKGEIPLDHPNGLCTLIPQLNKDLSTIGKELAEQAKYGGDKEFEKWMKKKKKKEIEKVAKQTKKATAKDLKEIKEKEIKKEIKKAFNRKVFNENVKSISGVEDRKNIFRALKDLKDIFGDKIKKRFDKKDCEDLVVLIDSVKKADEKDLNENYYKYTHRLKNKLKNFIGDDLAEEKGYEEISSVFKYTVDSSEFNSFKIRGIGDDETKKNVENLDSFFDKLPPIKEDIYVKRTTKTNAIINMLGAKDLEEAKEKLKEGVKTGSLVFKNQGYTSTSTYSNGQWSGSVIYCMKLNKGTKAFFAESFSNYNNGSELETLLKAGQNFRITDVAFSEDMDSKEFNELVDKTGYNNFHNDRSIIIYCESIPEDE